MSNLNMDEIYVNMDEIDENIDQIDANMDEIDAMIETLGGEASSAEGLGNPSALCMEELDAIELDQLIPDSVAAKDSEDTLACGVQHHKYTDPGTSTSTSHPEDGPTSDSAGITTDPTGSVDDDLTTILYDADTTDTHESVPQTLELGSESEDTHYTPNKVAGVDGGLTADDCNEVAHLLAGTEATEPKPGVSPKDTHLSAEGIQIMSVIMQLNHVVTKIKELNSKEDAEKWDEDLRDAMMFRRLNKEKRYLQATLRAYLRALENNRQGHGPSSEATDNRCKRKYSSAFTNTAQQVEHTSDAYQRPY